MSKQELDPEETYCGDVQIDITHLIDGYLEFDDVERMVDEYREIVNNSGFEILCINGSVVCPAGSDKHEYCQLDVYFKGENYDQYLSLEKKLIEQEHKVTFSKDLKLLYDF